MVGAAAMVLVTGTAAAQMLTPKEELGKSIFFDDNLSINRNQSCAACHAPEVGWTGPDELINAHGSVYEGSIAGRFGDRKPPSSAYATVSPIFHQDKTGLWVGGNFWDGRATGEVLGNPAADQARGPFLNPVEQALPDSACVVYRVCTAVGYPVAFVDFWGAEACDITWPGNTDTLCAAGSQIPLSDDDRGKSDTAYGNIALSIAAYEASYESNAFTSKWDASRGGEGGALSQEERRGFALFQGKGKCKLCHPTRGQGALLTDFTYDNLGVPKNPENPIYLVVPDFVDEGLGAFLRNAGYPEEVYEPELGKVKVPTLRNVDKRPTPGFVKAFGHNGYFKTLEGIVHFYNTRDVLPECPGDYTEAQALAADCWPPPEVPDNVNTDELGNLGLTDEEEDAIVEFLKALSDGYVPEE
jgi:cytochrome c peroxidase